MTKDGKESQVVSVSLDDLISLSQVVPDTTGDLVANVGINQKTFKTKEVANFFGKTVQWAYYIEDTYTRDDGSKIEPLRAPNNYRLWTLDHIRDIAIARYRRGSIDVEQLRAYLKRVVVAEAGGDWRTISIPPKMTA